MGTEASARSVVSDDDGVTGEGASAEEAQGAAGGAGPRMSGARLRAATAEAEDATADSEPELPFTD